MLVFSNVVLLLQDKPVNFVGVETMFSLLWEKYGPIFIFYVYAISYLHIGKKKKGSLIHPEIFMMRIFMHNSPKATWSWKNCEWMSSILLLNLKQFEPHETKARLHKMLSAQENLCLNAARKNYSWKPLTWRKTPRFSC